MLVSHQGQVVGSVQIRAFPWRLDSQAVELPVLIHKPNTSANPGLSMDEKADGVTMPDSKSSTRITIIALVIIEAAAMVPLIIHLANK